MKQILEIIPAGGISFDVYLADDDSLMRGIHLGRMEFGSIDANGQYVDTDEQIVAHARKTFDIGNNIEAQVL